MRRVYFWGICLLVMFVATAVIPAGKSAPKPLRYRWLFVTRSLMGPGDLQRTLDLLPRAQAAGYNGLVWSDSDLPRGPHNSPEYTEALRTLQREAARHGLELIPCVMGLGGGSEIVGEDPNLAEGAPVRDALFVAHAGKATLLSDPPLDLHNLGFESVEGDTFADWQQDNAGKSIFADHEITHSGKTAVRMEHIPEVDPKWGHCRIVQDVTVQPYHQYVVRAWVKTQDFAKPATARLVILEGSGAERSLADVSASQVTGDWTLLEATFNSLEMRSIRLYFGTWYGSEGKVWWDDISLAEVGLLNVLRRDGCPLTVKSENGVVYTEDKDFEPARDPQLSLWTMKGWHEPPAIVLTPSSRITEGERLRVSYYHPMWGYDHSPMCCLSEPKTYQILEAQIKWVNDVLHPRHFFMQHDEIRFMNWDDACQRRKMTPGQLLADNVRRCTKIIKRVNPKAAIWVWNDMFDPTSNAVEHYYLVNGSLTGSWKGLSKEIGIVNWSGELLGKNCQQFAGHPQILAGYYDGDSGGDGIVAWLEGAKDVPGISGAMYTTWRDRYDALEVWGRKAWGE